MKKITSILILMCIFISLFSFPVSASEAVTGDVSAEDYGILDALSVIDGESWADGTVATRAEFIQMCVNLTGNGNIKAVNTEPVFTDLTVSHWAYDAIMYAYSMGYITPYADGRIMPESPVTYGDAIKIMVNFLGYHIMAASNSGDSAQGYLKAASDIGLLDEVTADGIERPFMKSSAVRMAYNALSVELPIQYFSNNNVFFNVQEDRTLLKVKFDTYRQKGVLRADDYASLSHELARENFVTIDNENYYSANVDVEGLLGHTVLFYYTWANDNNVKELVYIKPVVDNEVFNISAHNLTGYRNMGISVTSDNGKKTSYKIGRDTTVIWNNRIVTSAEYAEKFKIKSGSAKLIDNDGDGIIEVVIIESLTPSIVEVNNTKDMELKLKNGKVYKLDKYRNYRIENRYGEKIDALALHVGDIVTVADPLSTDHTLVISVCKKNDARVVNSVDADGYILVDDGTELKYSKVAISDYKKIIIGDSYIFYTDKYDEIVYEVHVRSNEFQVVYLVNYKTRVGLDGKLVFRVMHGDGTITNMDGATNIKIRDKSGEYSVKKEAGIKTVLNQGGNEPLRQPVMLRTNALGEICEILMLANTDRSDLPFHEIAYTKVGGSGLRWYQTPRTLSNAIQLTLDTKLFAVPYDTRTTVDDEEFFVSNYLLFKTGVYYKETGNTGFFATPIGMDKDDIAADYLVWQYPEGYLDRVDYAKRSYKGIVTKISQVIDENGEEFAKITYCTATGIFGNTVLYKGTDGSLVVKGRKSVEKGEYETIDVGIGDIIQVSIDEYSGYATELSTIVYYDESKNMILNEGDSSSPAFYAWRLAKGVITKKKDGYAEVVITRPNGTTLTQVLDLAGAITINCNVKENLFAKDRAPDSLLSVDDSFFMIISGGLPTTLLIYE